ncbi:unnamed protein product [Nippostrongylus brasiliensis]|uniref:Histone H1.X (inferred by orthology to a C. elegans protein) n=1 Tax=Nippostrongylus brasiliensis TaxID=27835 RepID=A0A158R1M3_NIPBR|nr:unnamed protein product [Nippostrongylus brasiliensis]
MGPIVSRRPAAHHRKLRQACGPLYPFKRGPLRNCQSITLPSVYAAVPEKTTWQSAVFSPPIEKVAVLFNDLGNWLLSLPRNIRELRMSQNLPLQAVSAGTNQSELLYFYFIFIVLFSFFFFLLRSWGLKVAERQVSVTFALYPYLTSQTPPAAAEPNPHRVCSSASVIVSPMIAAAQQSLANMDGMLAAGNQPTVCEFRRLDEKMKQILQKKNPIPSPSHPTYLTMIKGAVLALNESKGASKPAILKYLAQHYQLGENLPKINNHLCTALRKALRDGNIEQTKGHGASGSFKVSSAPVKKTKPSRAAKKPVEVKPTKPAEEKSVKQPKKKTKKPAAKTAKPKKAKVTATKTTKVNKKTPVKKLTKTTKKSTPSAKPSVQKKRGAAKKKAPRAKKA